MILATLDTSFVHRAGFMIDAQASGRISFKRTVEQCSHFIRKLLHVNTEVFVRVEQWIVVGQVGKLVE